MMVRQGEATKKLAHHDLGTKIAKSEPVRQVRQFFIFSENKKIKLTSVESSKLANLAHCLTSGTKSGEYGEATGSLVSQ